MQDDPRNSDAVHAGAAAAFDEVGGDGEVFVDEVRRIGGVRMDAADLGGGDDDDVRFFRGEEIEDRVLVAEVEFGAGGGEESIAAAFGGFADEGGADHAAVAGDEEFFHDEEWRNEEVFRRRCRPWSIFPLGKETMGWGFVRCVGPARGGRWNRRSGR